MWFFKTRSLKGRSFKSSIDRRMMERRPKCLRQQVVGRASSSRIQSNHMKLNAANLNVSAKSFRAISSFFPVLSRHASVTVHKGKKVVISNTYARNFSPCAGALICKVLIGLYILCERLVLSPLKSSLRELLPSDALIIDNNVLCARIREGLHASKRVVSVRDNNSFRVPRNAHLHVANLLTTNCRKMNFSAGVFSAFMSQILACLQLASAFCVKCLISGLYMLIASFSLHYYRPAPMEVFRAGRVFILGIGLMLGTLGIGYRLLSLQTAEHKRWLQLASKQQDSSIDIQGVRGGIVDSAGRPFAVSIPAYSLGVHPRKIKDVDLVATTLSTLIGTPKDELTQKLQSEASFVWLGRGITRSVKDEVLSHNISGLSWHQSFKRYYPQEALASQIIGRVGRDGHGQSGIESTFDGLLTAATTRMPVRRDARGQLVAVSSFALVSPKLDVEDPLKLAALDSRELLRSSVDDSAQAGLRLQGDEVVLTIDAIVQGILEQELDASVKETGAKQAFSVILDAKSGEILGMAQEPRFNPNADVVDSSALRNIVIQDAFEPGSTMKPLVAAAALDARLVRADEVFNCENGRFSIGKHTVRDVHPIGMATFSDVLVQSSNVGMAKMGLRMQKRGLHDAMTDYGFGELTGIGLSGEGRGILRPFTRWAEIDVATHAFGQGMAVTGLQLVRAYAVLANGGLLVTPTLIKGGDRKPEQRIISEESARIVRDALYGVTESEHGTGKMAGIDGLRVAGKTGTAQKPSKSSKGYDPDKVVASFIGMVDASDVGVQRSLVMLVVIDEPNVKPRWGGVIAAPVFKRSMERVVSHLMASESKTPIRTAYADIAHPNA